MCECPPSCVNRLVQHGVTVPLRLEHDAVKGFRVVTLRALEAGRFVCEYAGELITVGEAKERTLNQHRCNLMNYIIAVREHSSAGEVVATTIVDPCTRGNVGRFMNHSCEANLQMIPVRCDSDVPMLALFCRRHVAAGEELTFDYGSGISGEHENRAENKRKPCLCKSANCVGYLPFNPTVLPAPE